MQGENIICVAPRSWFSLWKDTQAIMSRIAQHNRVWYFEPARDPEMPLLRAMIGNLPYFLKLSVQPVQDNLVVIQTPSSLPLARRHLPRGLLRQSVPFVFRTNGKILAWHIRRAVRALNIQQPVLWLFGLYSTDLIGQFGEKLVCYSNYDEFAGFPANTRIRDLIRAYDDQLATRADVIFCTSQAQTRIRKALNPQTYFIPNAVDFDLFHRTLEPDLPLPADLAAIPRPVIGYAGWLANQIDVELLRKVAETYPRCSLVLVGPDQLDPTEESRRLHALPNVFFLGRKPRADLPNYLQAFDVALIPYWLASEHVQSGYPTKLHEYLAAGRSVVATAMPELQAYRHVMRLAETHDEFIRLVGEAITDHSPAVVEARLAVARDNTWERRVSDINAVLDQHLAHVGA